MHTRSKVLRVVAVVSVIYISMWVAMFIPYLIYGSIFEGVWWSSGGGGMLFPIPLFPGNAAVITPANPLDAILYLIFLQYGFWIIWLGFLLLYAFSPYAIKREKE